MAVLLFFVMMVGDEYEVASEEVQLLYTEPNGIHQYIVLNFHGFRIGINGGSCEWI